MSLLIFLEFGDFHLEVVHPVGLGSELFIFLRNFFEDDFIIILFGFIELLLHFLIFDL